MRQRLGPASRDPPKHPVMRQVRQLRRARLSLERQRLGQVRSCLDVGFQWDGQVRHTPVCFQRGAGSLRIS